MDVALLNAVESPNCITPMSPLNLGADENNPEKEKISAKAKKLEKAAGGSSKRNLKELVKTHAADA